MLSQFSDNTKSLTILDDIMLLPDRLSFPLITVADYYIRECVPKSYWNKEGHRWVLREWNFITIQICPREQHAWFTFFGEPSKHVVRSTRFPLLPDQNGYSRGLFNDPLQLNPLLQTIDETDQLKQLAKFGPLGRLLRR